MPLQHSLLELTPIGRNGARLSDQSPALFLVQLDTDHCFPKDKTSTVFGDAREFLHNLKRDLASELSLFSGKNASELGRSVTWTDEFILNSPPQNATVLDRNGVKAWRLNG